MITLTSTEGALLKNLTEPGVYGFHETFGFISERASKEREGMRNRVGLKTKFAWSFLFSLQTGQSGSEIAPVMGCKAVKSSSNAWRLDTTVGSYLIQPQAALAPARLAVSTEEEERLWKWAFPFAFVVMLLFRLIPSPQMETLVEPPLVEPVTVKVINELKRVVVVAPTRLPTLQTKPENKAARVAVQQNLGFLGLLGKKDLSKALGGIPSTTGPATPGAGAGGTEGSGGELLVGLGQGVKRTTVGNTGVQGLGGIGNGKGPGGGAGGYGDSLVGSGQGKALSSLGAGHGLIPLAKDIELEGGLDRAVIQATIAKYISQVRACYERGLEKNPGLVGKVSMEFEVGAAGSLNYAKVGKSSLGSLDVEQCIASQMLSWAFPKPLGGVNVRVTYPFLLRPSNS